MTNPSLAIEIPTDDTGHAIECGDLIAGSAQVFRVLRRRYTDDLFVDAENV